MDNVIYQTMTDKYALLMNATVLTITATEAARAIDLPHLIIGITAGVTELIALNKGLEWYKEYKEKSHETKQTNKIMK